MKTSEKFWMLVWSGCNINMAYFLYIKYQVYLEGVGHNKYCSFFLSSSCDAYETHSFGLGLALTMILFLSVIFGTLGYVFKYWDVLNDYLNRNDNE